MVVAIQANISSIHSTPNSLIELMRCCALCHTLALSLVVFSIVLTEKKFHCPFAAATGVVGCLSFIGRIFICIFHLFVHRMHDRVFSPSLFLLYSPLRPQAVSDSIRFHFVSSLRSFQCGMMIYIILHVCVYRKTHDHDQRFRSPILSIQLKLKMRCVFSFARFRIQTAKCVSLS